MRGSSARELLEAFGEECETENPFDQLRAQIDSLRQALLNTQFKNIIGGMAILPASVAEQIQDLVGDLSKTQLRELLPALDAHNDVPCCPINLETIVKFPVWVRDRAGAITGPVDYEALLRQFLFGNFHTPLKSPDANSVIIQIFVEGTTLHSAYLSTLRLAVEEWLFAQGFSQMRLQPPAPDAAPLPATSLDTHSHTHSRLPTSTEIKKIHNVLKNYQLNFTDAEVSHLYQMLKPYDIVLILDNGRIPESAFDELSARVSLIASVASCIDDDGIEVFPVKSVKLDQSSYLKDLEGIRSINDDALMKVMYSNISGKFLNSNATVLDCFADHIKRFTADVITNKKPVLLFIATTKSLSDMDEDQKIIWKARWESGLEEMFGFSKGGQTQSPLSKNRISFIDCSNDCSNGDEAEAWMDELDNHPLMGLHVDTVSPYLKEKKQIEKEAARLRAFGHTVVSTYTPEMDGKKVLMGAVDPELDARDGSAR
jgi:hypothetical protein